MTYTKHICRALITAAMIGLPTIGHADCYADYKAKADNGELRLHYGVIRLSGSDCSDVGNISGTISGRISQGGWQLLRVMSSFDENGLNDRRANAGEYFLRY